MRNSPRPLRTGARSSRDEKGLHLGRRRGRLDRSFEEDAAFAPWRARRVSSRGHLKVDVTAVQAEPGDVDVSSLQARMQRSAIPLVNSSGIRIE